MIDAAFGTVMERRRPEAQQSSMWLARWEVAIRRSLDVLEQEVAERDPGFGLSGITYACALGYLDLRMEEFSWREDRPRLAEWNRRIATWPSMAATVPG